MLLLGRRPLEIESRHFQGTGGDSIGSHGLTRRGKDSRPAGSISGGCPGAVGSVSGAGLRGLEAACPPSGFGAPSANPCKTYAKQIGISGGSKTYNFGVSKDKFVLNEKLTILIGGNKTLVKKFQLRPKKETVTIKVGQLFFGDINGDNKINSVDKTLLLESISNQIDQGDLNFDGVSNSLDWAILLANFGKIGKF
ncbi:MAG: dockerin type I repeat-containing protein [SAR324 cluster bacterium]|nr:dockerin type I repeat-containing protein [SAR324 cluster bacterium]